MKAAPAVLRRRPPPLPPPRPLLAGGVASAGVAPRQLHPAQQEELLDSGYGITNLVNRGTATADELAPEEFVRGRRRLAAKVRRYSLKIGLGVVEPTCHAFECKQAKVAAPRPSNSRGEGMAPAQPGAA